MILHWDGSSPLLMVLLMIVFYMWAKVDKRRREKEISSLYTINDDKPTKEYKQINFNDKKKMVRTLILTICIFLL